ncbi:MAG: hypothetical protein KKF08_14030, partial [Gammaproteobacteria bacterium]|nr:hypothetical protein [Gammaproteobacteria bacterium]
MSHVTPMNPFVGLRPYESSDSLYYFGRGEQVKTLLRQLHQHRFVAVVGSSGSGKSSLIRAGLIPQLEAGFLVQERDQWLVARMKPGEAPLGNLVGSLMAALPGNSPHPNLPPQGGKEQELLPSSSLLPSPLAGEGLGMGGNLLIQSIREQGSQAILDLLTPYLADSDTNLFILVDQFEELFRFGLEKGKTEQRQEAEEFVSLLLALARQDKLPIYVCLTMRSDFLGDCDAFYGLPEAINQSQFLVPRLTRSQRQEVITHPVQLAGARIAPRLVDRLLNEGIDTRDDLPVLQHVLMRTWDVWQAGGGDGALDVAHYEQAHTIHQALDSHANEALEELDARQQDIAKKLFQALTAVDAGNRRIRRPVHLDEVCTIAAATPPEVMTVINRFREQGRSFLVLSSENMDDNPLIDISHESLIRQWGKLAEWVDEEAEAAKTYRRLVETAQLHDGGRASLYREADLEQALRWREALPPAESALIWAWRYHPDFDSAIRFLEQSQHDHQQRLAAEKAEQERQAQLLREKAELEEQQRRMAEQQVKEQRKTLLRTRWLSGVMALLTVFMFVAAWFAMQSANDAELASQRAEQSAENALMKEEEANRNLLEANYNLAKVFEEKARQLISQDVLNGKEVAQPVQLRRAWLYGLEAAKQEVPEKKLAVLPATLGLLSAIREQDLSTERKQTPTLKIGEIGSVAYSPDGKFIASGSYDNTVRVWDAGTGETLKTLQGHTNEVNAVAYSP